MNHPTTRLLTAALLAVALSGCATRAKQAAPAQDLASNDAPATALPPSTAPQVPPPVVQTLQQELAAAAGEDRVYFAVDSHDLDDAARATLLRHAAWLSARPGVRARIIGNADERGTREYNLALGARRANAARQFLVGQGVSPVRLETISYGKDQPLDPAFTEEAWARNRNAQTLVIDLAER